MANAAVAAARRALPPLLLGPDQAAEQQSIADSRAGDDAGAKLELA
jgi:hypothetical protein